GGFGVGWGAGGVSGRRPSVGAEPRPPAAAPAVRPAAVQPSAPQPAPAAQPAGSPPAPVEGGRAPIPSIGLGAPLVGAPTPGRRPATIDAAPPLAPTATDSRHSEAYYEIKGTIFGALIEAIDLSQLAKLDADSSREEIRDIVTE